MRPWDRQTSSFIGGSNPQSNLAGVEKTPVRIASKHFEMLQDPPSKSSDDILLRCYARYPIWFYSWEHVFPNIYLQLYRDSADIEKAFENPDSSIDPRNQIEKYLDFVFGGCDLHKDGNGCHCAKIDLDSDSGGLSSLGTVKQYKIFALSTFAVVLAFLAFLNIRTKSKYFLTCCMLISRSSKTSYSVICW